MTDTLIDRADSGDIHRPIGENCVRIDLGEATQRIDRRTIHASVVGAIPRKVIEIDDTVTFHIPETIGVVADTAQLTLLGSLTATLEGELRPAAPGPFPGPLPPDPKPAPKPGYVGRHRLGLRGRAARGLRAPLWAQVAIGAGLVVLAGAYAGLVLAALAVFW